MNTWKTMVSKFPGRCHTCGQAFNEGETVQLRKDDLSGKWEKRCLACGRKAGGAGASVTPQPAHSPSGDIELDATAINNLKAMMGDGSVEIVDEPKAKLRNPSDPYEAIPGWGAWR